MATRLHEVTGGDDFESDIEAGSIYARHDQAFLEGRILELERLLANPVVRDKSECEGAVDFGATVTVKCPEGSFTVRILKVE